MPPHVINDTSSSIAMFTNHDDHHIGILNCDHEESTAEQSAAHEKKKHYYQPLPNFSNMMEFPSDWWPDYGEVHGFQQHFRRHYFTSILPTITEEQEADDDDMKLFSKLKIALNARKEGAKDRIRRRKMMPSDWGPDYDGEVLLHGCFRLHAFRRRRHFTCSSILPTITEEQAARDDMKVFSKLKITLNARKEEAKDHIRRKMKVRASVPRVE